MSPTPKSPTPPLPAACASCGWSGTSDECLDDKTWGSICCPQCFNEAAIKSSDKIMSDLEVDVFKISAPIMRMETPDPFVIQFPNGSKILFYKDGRVVGEFQNPDDSAKEFLKFVETYYQDHIVEAEKRGQKHGFQHGYLIACCNISNLHDEPGIASDVLADAGITEEEIKELDLSEYDAKALAEIRKNRTNDPIRKG